MQKEIAASLMIDPNSSPIGSDWLYGPNSTQEQVDKIYPLRDGSLRNGLFVARSKIAERLSVVIPEQDRPTFVASMGMAETADGVVGVLVEHEIPERLGEHISTSLAEAEVNPKTAKTVGKLLARYAHPEDRQQFRDDIQTVINWGQVIKVIRDHDVNAELALRSKRVLRLGQASLPVVLALVSCLAVPDVDPNTPAQPDMFEAYFKAFSNDVIVRTAGWGATIGAVISGVTSAFKYGKAVLQPDEGESPMAIHSAIASGLINVGLETFENGVKAGAAATGLAVFAGDVPVENVRTIGTVFMTGLAIQTVVEYISEPLTRIKSL